MGRIRNRNKKPMTTLSVDEDLLPKFVSYKRHGERWTDFLNRIFNEWTISDAVIEDLKADIANKDAIIELYSKNKVEIAK